MRTELYPIYPWNGGGVDSLGEGWGRKWRPSKHLNVSRWSKLGVEKVKSLLVAFGVYLYKVVFSSFALGWLLRSRGVCFFRGWVERWKGCNVQPKISNRTWARWPTAFFCVFCVFSIENLRRHEIHLYTSIHGSRWVRRVKGWNGVGAWCGRFPIAGGVFSVTEFRREGEWRDSCRNEFCGLSDVHALRHLSLFSYFFSFFCVYFSFFSSTRRPLSLPRCSLESSTLEGASNNKIVGPFLNRLVLSRVSCVEAVQYPDRFPSHVLSVRTGTWYWFYRVRAQPASIGCISLEAVIRHTDHSWLLSQLVWRVTWTS